MLLNLKLLRFFSFKGIYNKNIMKKILTTLLLVAFVFSSCVTVVKPMKHHRHHRPHNNLGCRK